ncbi:hypothetical protein L596_017564 [Steinernema carpocapsae]|nr:hypothetical protein L596_017564 [Steinernema carpocapsae]
MPAGHYYSSANAVNAVGEATVNVDISFLKKQMRKISSFHGHYRSVYLFSAYLGVVGALTCYSLREAVKKTNEYPAILRTSDKNYRHPSVPDSSTYY